MVINLFNYSKGLNATKTIIKDFFKFLFKNK